MHSKIIVAPLLTGEPHKGFNRPVSKFLSRKIRSRNQRSRSVLYMKATRGDSTAPTSQKCSPFKTTEVRNLPISQRQPRWSAITSPSCPVVSINLWAIKQLNQSMRSPQLIRSHSTRKTIRFLCISLKRNLNKMRLLFSIRRKPWLRSGSFQIGPSQSM